MFMPVQMYVCGVCVCVPTQTVLHVNLEGCFVRARHQNYVAAF